MLITLLLALATADGSDSRVRQAIADAVRDRMGAAAAVTIEGLAIDADVDAPAIRAVPEPGSKLDRAIRFILRSSGEQRGRTGSATARVLVSVPHAHASRNLDRGVELTAGDVVAVTHDISSGALRALPTLSALAQARTVRPIAQGACIGASTVAMLPAVRGGHDVVAIARVGGVEARTTVTAAENGDAGSVIRVVNRQSQRPLKARVLAAGVVEVIHD